MAIEKKDMAFVYSDLIKNTEYRIGRLEALKEHLNQEIGDTPNTELMIYLRELRNKVETFISWDIDELNRLKSEAESIKN